MPLGCRKVNDLSLYSPFKQQLCGADIRILFFGESLWGTLAPDSTGRVVFKALGHDISWGGPTQHTMSSVGGGRRHIDQLVGGLCFENMGLGVIDELD